jgi:hypothetical protein
LTQRFARVNVATAADFLLRNAAFRGQALFTRGYARSLSLVEDFAMQWTNDGEKWRAWLVDYSAARSRAIEWLGDRYLLARPINRRRASGLDHGEPWFRKERATARR